MHYSKLIREARKAKRASHSPYSKFRVGAALLTTKGKTYTGSNIEVSSYSLTLCAERTALFKAFSEGERSFRAIAIASDEKDFTPPCGACRQVIMDLAGDIEVILTNSKGKHKIVRASELLPLPFGARNLRK